MNEEQEKRFWPKVDRSGGPDSCWLWTAATNTKGYGAFAIETKPTRLAIAHRVAWEHFNGPLPSAKLGDSPWCLLHSCDTPRCVNPRHLRPGSRADNNADMRAKGRGCNPPARQGAAHSSARFTAEQIVDLRARHASGGVTYAALAREFGVSAAAIWLIVAGKNWSCIPPSNDASQKAG